MRRHVARVHIGDSNKSHGKENAFRSITRPIISIYQIFIDRDSLRTNSRS